MAGVFDVRGRCAAYWSAPAAKKLGRRRQGPKWNLLAMVDCRRESVVWEMKRLVGGGCVYIAKQRSAAPGNWKQGQRTRYVASGSTARLLLRAILPYSRVRADEIVQALRLDETRPGRPA